MILQLGALFGSAFQGLTNLIGGTVLPAAVGVGTEYLKGVIQKELNRDVINAQQDAVKAAIRQAANAVSPIAAPGNVAVGTGGAPIGSAFLPTVFSPTSIAPATLAATVVNPNYGLPAPAGRLPTRNAGMISRLVPTPMGPTPGSIGDLLPLLGIPGLDIRGPMARGAEEAMRSRDGTTIPLGITAGGEFNVTGRYPGVEGMNGVVPTGLPAVGRFQKNALGQVQWFMFDGQNMIPIDRARAKECIQKGCIYRLDVFRGRYVKLGSRRMNPMNVRAFFRAGRRIDAAERICRKMYSEKRRQKTGTMRRKSKSRKK